MADLGFSCLYDDETPCDLCKYLYAQEHANMMQQLKIVALTAHSLVDLKCHEDFNSFDF
jgi:hypothetical protein